MKNTFTKFISRLLLILCFLFTGYRGFSQYTVNTIATGGHYTAMAKDQSNNIYVVRYNGTSYEVAKFLNGDPNNATVLITGLSSGGTADIYSWGLAVTSRGDVFVTNAYQPDGWEIIKLDYPFYNARTIQTGKYYTALLIDRSDDLFALEYDEVTNTYRIWNYYSGIIGNGGYLVYNGFSRPADPTTYPWGMVMDSHEDIFVLGFLEENGGSLIKLSYPLYYRVTTLATNRSFTSLAIDANDNLYTSEGLTPTTAKVVKYTYPVSVNATGTDLYNGLSSVALFYPWGLAVNSRGQVYVNDGVAAGNGRILRLDPPTSLVTGVNRLNVSPIATPTVDYAVIFDKAVTGVTTSSFSVSTTGGITGASVAAVSGSGTTYTVTVNTGTGDGTLRLDVTGTGVTPTVTNVPYTTGPVYTIDKTKPVGSIIINNGTTITRNATVTLALAATDATPMQMHFSNDGISWSAYETYTASKLWPLTAGDGLKTVYVQYMDAALNVQDYSSTITLDQTAPVVSTVSVPANGYYQESDNLDFTVAFNGAINLNTTGGSPYIDITIGSSVVRAILSNTASSALTFTYTVVNGDHDMDGIAVGNLVLNGSTIKDAAGNDAILILNNIGSTANVGVNTTHPSVTLSTDLSVVNVPFTTTITFSEAVTGFAISDITVSNATLSNLQTSDNTTFTVLVTPTADGTVTLDVAADVAQNIGLNGNTFAAQLNVLYDATPPVISFVSVPVNGYYAAGSNMDFTVTFSEPVVIPFSGVTPYVYIIIGSSVVEAVPISSTTTSLTFRYTVVDGDQDMDGIAVNISDLYSHNIIDGAGNDLILTLNNVGNTSGVFVNTTHPSVIVSTTVPANVNAPYTATITFSEAVTGFAITDITTTNATLSNLQTADNITFTVLVTPVTDGTVSVAVAANVAANIANNGNDASNTINVMYDATAPHIITVGVPASGYYNVGTTLQFTVLYSGGVVVVSTTGGTPYLDLVLTSGTVHADYISGSGTNSLIFRYTVQPGDMDMDGITLGSVVLNGGTIQDIATNNAGLTLNNIDNTANVRVNTAHPSVVVSTTAPAFVNQAITATIKFSEAVTGLTTGGLNKSNATLSNLQTSDNITYTVLVTPTGNGPMTVRVPPNAAVNIGDNGNTISNNLIVIYDITAPVVTSVTVPANGYYKAASTLDFTVNFDGNIDLNTTGGTPYINVTIGTSVVQATCTGKSGSAALTFSYTVQNGDMDMDGISVGSLVLNGGTIKDMATNNAVLTLNNTESTIGVFVNTTLPSVVVSTTAAAIVKAPFTATITFSEAVTGFAIGNVTATNATLSSLQTSDNITYTVLVTPTVDGAVTVNVPADAAVNIGDNGNTVSNTLSVTYDGAIPVVTSVAVPANGYYKAGNTLSFTVKFSENILLYVTGGRPYMNVTIGSAVVQAAYTSTNGFDLLTFSYTVQNGDMDMDGITVNSLVLNGSDIEDPATNNAILTLNNIASTTGVFVNTSHPSVALSTTAAAIVNTPFTATITFSEAVTGFAIGDIVASNATLGNLQTSDNITYTVLVIPITDGAVTMSVPAAIAVNIGDNDNTASAADLVITYDVTAPVVTSVAVPANGYYNDGTTLNFTVNYNENVIVDPATGFPYINVELTTGGVRATYVSGSGTSALIFNYTVQPGDMDMDGITLGSLVLNGGTIKDVATNNAGLTLNNTGSTANVRVNTAKPSVVVSTAAPALVNQAITATITFNEAVTGLTVGDFIAPNATLSNLQTSDNITYTVLVTPTADGTVTVNVPANAAVNIGNNGNTVSNTLSFIYDITAPVVTSVTVPANGYYKAASSLNFTVNFDGNIILNATGGTPYINVTIGASVVQATCTGTSGSAALTFSYTVQNGEMDMDGISVSSLVLNGAGIKDPATNNANLTLNNIAPTTGVFVNTAQPSVVISTTAAVIVNAPFTATITFNEAVTGFTIGDIVTSNATLSNLQTSDNITYTVLVTPTVDGAVTVNVPADAAVNIGDNGNTVSNTLSVAYDVTAPVVTSVAVPADGYYKAATTLDFTVNFDGNVLLNTTGGTLYINVTIGSSVVQAACTGTSGSAALTFRYTVQNGDMDMDGITVGNLVLNGSTIQDAATNNAILTLNNIQSTTGVLVNTSHPSVVLSTTAAAIVNTPFTTTITFSEAVTGFAIGDIVASNATLSNLQTTDNISYTVLVTPITDGAVTMNVPAAVAVNIGDNDNTASAADLVITYDVTAPVVASVAVPANGYYNDATTLNFTVNYNENVIVDPATGFPYINVGLTTGGVRATYVSGSGTSALVFSYTVQPGDMDMDGITLGSLVLNGGTIKDIATNNAILTLNNIAATTGVLVNTATPSVVMSTTAAARINTPFDVKIVFSEAVTGMSVVDLNITNGTAGNLTTTDNITYMATVTPTTDGTVSVYLPAGQAINVVNNSNTVSDTVELVYDITAPVITASQTFTTSERSPVGTLAGTVTAIETVGTLQNWTITGDDSGGAFSIDNTGKILVKDVAILNSNANTTVHLTITVSDGLNISTAESVAITIRFVNQAPVLDNITSAVMCTNTDVQTIQLTGASATETDQTYSFTITADQPYFEVLSVSATGLITYQLKAGAAGMATVTVTIKDDGGTTSGGVDSLRRSFTITANSLPVVSISVDKGTTISKGDIIHLTATGGNSYSWDAADGNISGEGSDILEARPMNTTTYKVTVTSAANCSDTANITVKVVDDFKVDAINILSPNGDGKNDKWVIRNIDSYPNNEVRIYDRAGRMVYSRRNYNNDWDGTMNGSPLAEGTYYYILTIDGGKTAKGYITIIRDRN